MTVAERKAPVRTSGGITILPDLALDELEPEQSAMLILPGGDTWDAGKNTAALECAGRFLAAGVPIAAICGATAGLARAGILDNVMLTRKEDNNAEHIGALGQSRLSTTSEPGRSGEEPGLHKCSCGDGRGQDHLYRRSGRCRQVGEDRGEGRHQGADRAGV